EPIELRVTGADDGGHAADADGFDQLEMSELSAPDAVVALWRNCLGRRDVARDDRGRVVGRRRGPREDVFGGKRRSGKARPTVGRSGRGGMTGLASLRVAAVVVVDLHEPPPREVLWLNATRMP